MANDIIAEFIATQPEATQDKLHELREIILKAAPDAEEKMNYGVAAFALVPGGKRDQQIMMAGFKKHIGFYPSPEVVEAFEEKLSAYKHAKGSVQFLLTEPLPEKLITDMIALRQKQLGL